LKTLVASLLASLAVAAAAAPLDYPAAAKKPVTDSFFGTKVTEDYRWLEDGKDPAVREWSQEQMQVTRQFLDALPILPKLRAELKDLYGNSPASHSRMKFAGSLFAIKRQPPKNQPFLVVMKDPSDSANERVLVDPNAMEKGTAIDWYVPSLDGKYVAVSLSKNGSEDGTAHVLDVATGKETGDAVPRVQWPTGGGSIEWDEKGTGFWYTRYPQGSERPAEDMNFYQQVYFHKLCTPASSDTYAVGKDFPRIAETRLESTRDGKYTLAKVANGDGRLFSYYLRDPSGAWKRFASDGDKLFDVVPGFDGNLYALSHKDAPRGKVLSMPMAAPVLAKAKVVVPQGDDNIEDVTATRTRVYVTYVVGGPTEVRVFDTAGKLQGKLPTEPVSSNDLGARLEGDDVMLDSQSYVSAPAWSRYSASDNRLAKTDLNGEYKFGFGDAEVVREMAVSKDGTKVPVSLIMKKGTKRDGSNALLLTGYGGYGVNYGPYFSTFYREWLDHGGIVAVVNLRGGGEYGEPWHLAGNLTRKQHVFDDMIGAAEHVVKRGYTKPERLAARGGSNGGLLMGAIVTQRPDLFRAVWSSVGIYDMLRVELTPNGAFNVTEFGSVKDPAQFKALYAYSPYHHVKDGVDYPAMFFSTGENDGRVDPYNSRKMAARMQAADPQGRPILLRISMDTGHGIGTGLDKRVEQDADGLAFLMSQLGMQ
jgi:prolyl oligopeptidase